MAWVKWIAIAAVVFAVLYAVKEIYQFGGDNARNSIERQNNEAAHNADSDRLSYDDCPDGLWDFATGKCRGAP